MIDLYDSLDASFEPCNLVSVLDFSMKMSANFYLQILCLITPSDSCVPLF